MILLARLLEKKKNVGTIRQTNDTAIKIGSGKRSVMRSAGWLIWCARGTEGKPNGMPSPVQQYCLNKQPAWTEPETKTAV